MRSLIKLKILEGRNADFEAAFVKAGMLSRPKALDPAFEGELLRTVDDPSTYYVVAQWSSADAYAKWQATSADGADEAAMAVLAKLLVDPIPGKILDVVATSRD